MRYWKAILFAPFVACVGLAIMAPTGGVPSRPKFQAVQANFSDLSGTASAPVAAFTAFSAAPTIILDETDQGADQKLWRIHANSASLNFGAIDDAVTTSKFALQFTRTGNVISAVNLGNTTDNPNVTVNGNAIPGIAGGTGKWRIVLGSITETSGGCSNNVSQGVSGCSRGAAGSIMVNFGTAFVLQPYCTVAPYNTSGGVAVETDVTPSTGSAGVLVKNTSGAAFDGFTLSIICIGV